MLLLDEPFGALDAKVRQDLRQWLDELHRELVLTSLLVTHDQEEALELANQVVVMHEGAVEQVGSPSEIYDDPRTPFVAGFVGSANVLHGVVERGHVHLGAFQVPGAGHLADGAAATAFVRPHDVHVRPKGPNGHGGDGAALAIGRVERISSLGWLARSRSGSTARATTPSSPTCQAELAGATEGDLVSVDLRNPKAFDRTATRSGARSRPSRERALADRGRRGDSSDREIPVEVLGSRDWRQSSGSCCSTCMTCWATSRTAPWCSCSRTGRSSRWRRRRRSG